MSDAAAAEVRPAPAPDDTVTAPARALTPTPVLLARFWRDYVRGRLGVVALASVLMVAVAAANSSYAYLAGWVGQLIETENTQILWIAPIVVVAVTGAKALALFAQVVVTQRLALRVIEALQRDMYAALNAADFARLTAQAPGELVSRFVSDVDRVRESLTRAASNLIRDALTVVGAAAVMFIFDWLLALIVLLVYPLAFQPVLALGRRLRKRANAAQEQMGALTAFLSESFSGARLVKTYRLEDYQAGRAKSAFARRFDLAMGIARDRAGVEPILEVLGGAAFAGVIAFAAWRMGQGGFAVSDLLAFLAALGVMAPAARAVGTLNAVAQEGLAALDRVFHLLDEAPTITSQPGAPGLGVTRGAVRFENVTFDYADGTRALDGVSFEAAPGQLTALVGPSGGGKTSLLALPPRLYDPTRGRVLIDGQDVALAELASVRDAISVVSQDAVLFDDTVRANVAFGRADADDEAVWAALDAAAAREFVEAMDAGLDARVGPFGGRLSGGQRQRVALARAVLRDAPILLLDEATSALDAESEARVQAALERLSEGRTTIAVAHRLATVRRADRILVMENGRIVEEGDDATLAAKGGLYARLRALQFSGDTG